MNKRKYLIGLSILTVAAGLVTGAILGFGSTKGEVSSAAGQPTQESLPSMQKRALVIRHDTMSEDSLQKLVRDRQSDADIHEITLSDGVKATIIVPKERAGEVNVDSMVAEMNKNASDAQAVLKERESQYGRSATARQKAVATIQNLFGARQVDYKMVLPPVAYPSNTAIELYSDNDGYQYLVDPKTDTVIRREPQSNGSFNTTHAGIFNENGEYKGVMVTAEAAKAIATDFIKKAGIPAGKASEVVNSLREENGKGGAYVFLYGPEGEGLEGLKGSYPLELVVEPVTGEIIRYSSTLAIQ